MHWGVLSNLTHLTHYDDVIMTMLASQITSLTVVYSIVYSGVNQIKHQSSASLAFVREIHRGPVNFPHKWPVTRKMFPFDGVIMLQEALHILQNLISCFESCCFIHENVFEIMDSQRDLEENHVCVTLWSAVSPVSADGLALSSACCYTYPSSHV